MISSWALDPTQQIPAEIAQTVRDLVVEHHAAILGGTMSVRKLRNLGTSQRIAENVCRIVRARDPRVDAILGRAPESPADEHRLSEVAHDKHAVGEDGDTMELVHVPDEHDVQAPVVTFAQFVERLDVDLDVWTCTDWTPGTHAVTMKLRQPDGTDRPQVVRMWGHKARFTRRPIPLSQVPDWQPMEIGDLEHPEPQAVEQLLVVPDLQVGYVWSERHDVLTPLHDRRCMDLYLQLAKRIRPTRVLLLGDNLDLAPWSTKFPRDPGLNETTTQSIRALGMWLRALRVAVGPGVPITYIEGNHEARINKALVEKLPELARMRGLDDGAPYLSVERLLGLRQAGIDYVGPYGASHWVPRLEDAVQVLHGVRVSGQPGATSAAVLRDVRHSAVFGHIHRVEVVHSVVETPAGTRIIGAGSPGCGCRVDGVVPGHPGRPNWQQGVGIIYVDRAAGATHLDMRTIRDGRLPFDGRVLVGSDYAELEADWTGYEQVARGRSAA